jgi:hypothetical protein
MGNSNHRSRVFCRNPPEKHFLPTRRSASLTSPDRSGWEQRTARTVLRDLKPPTSGFRAGGAVPPHQKTQGVQVVCVRACVGFPSFCKCRPLRVLASGCLSARPSTPLPLYGEKHVQRGRSCLRGEQQQQRQLPSIVRRPSEFNFHQRRPPFHLGFWD